MTQLRAIIDGKMDTQVYVIEVIRQSALSSGFSDSSTDLMIDRLNKLMLRSYSQGNPTILMFELHNNTYHFTLTTANGSTISAMYFN